MVTDVALVVVQLSVLNCPAVMVVGEAESVAVGAPGEGGGGGDEFDESISPQPVSEKTIKNRETKIQTEQNGALDTV